MEANTLDSMRDILTLPLNAVIAECLNVDVGRVHPGARLIADLDMSPTMRKRLQREIAFIFDCAEPDMHPTMKVEELVDQVARIELARLYPNVPEQTGWFINPFRGIVR